MNLHDVEGLYACGRRAWSIQEKVAVLDYLHAHNGNKKRTARDLGIPCTKMLRDWVQSESEIRFRVAKLSGSKRISKRSIPVAQTMKARSHVVGKTLHATANIPNQRTNEPPQDIIPDWRHEQSLSMRENEYAIEVRASRHGSSAGGNGEQSTAEPRNATSSNPGGAISNNSLMDAIPTAGLARMVDHWLEEDCAGFDYGAAVVGSAPATAFLFAKTQGLLAGRVFFDAVFHRLGCEVTWMSDISEGSMLHPIGFPNQHLKVATVTGPVRLILQGERVALNALAECSGIATAAARFVAIAKNARWNGVLAGTRKTTPGFRLVQKYGMLVGGMDTHRMDLSSMIMLKDNHIAASGSISAAVLAARAVGGFSLKIDVECSTLSQAVEAADAGVDIVMLDNFDPEPFRETARALRERYPHLTIEGSGGICESTIADYFCDAANVLSFSINRHAVPLDFSLKIQH
jgi:nicotinate-nucleotide pyrophosphorylase (carboxylating)